MPLGDTSHALDHANYAFADDDEREQLQSLDDVRVLEADDAPGHSDEEDSKAFDNSNDDPVELLSRFLSIVNVIKLTR